MNPTIRWLDEREARAWQALQTMQLQLDARLARQLHEDSGLSYADYHVLVALTSDEDGQLRAYELGRQLGWEQSRVSHQVARMIGRGLVERRSCASDRRGAFISITPHGRAAITAATPGHVAAVRRYFVDVLSPAQLDAVGSAAEAVLAAWAEPDAIGDPVAAPDDAGRRPRTTGAAARS